MYFLEIFKKDADERLFLWSDVSQLSKLELGITEEVMYKIPHYYSSKILFD